MGKPVGVATNAYQPPPVQNNIETKTQAAGRDPNTDSETANPATLQYSAKQKAAFTAEKQIANDALEIELRKLFRIQ